MNITILDLISYLKKHIPLIIVTLAVSAVVGVIYVYQNQSYVASTTIKYADVNTETGENSSGQKVDPYEIISPKVIESAIKSANAATRVEEVRSSISISPFTSQTTKKLQEALTEKGETFEYYPNEYTITFRHSGKRGQQYGVKLMNKLLEAYDEYVRESHTNTKKIADIFTGIDYNKYDYMEICDLYVEQIDSIIENLDRLATAAPDFRSPKTGMTFMNLKFYFANLRATEYTKLYAYVREGCLSKNPELLLKNYQYKTETLRVTQAKKAEESKISYDILVEFYKRYKEGKMQNDLGEALRNNNLTSNKNNELIREDDMSKIITTYDSIITGYVDSGVEASTAQRQIDHNWILYNAFSHDTVSEQIKQDYTQKAEELIATIDSQLKNYIDLANDTINSYNIYTGTQYLTYLSSVSTKATLSRPVIVLFALAAGTALGMIIAVIIEIMKKLREEAAVEAKRRRMSMIESGTMPKNMENLPPLDRALFDAITNEFKEFKLFYQPIVDSENKWIGAEALVRWDSAEFGMVLPNNFIAIAEKYDVMELLGKWILKEACIQCKKWNEEISSDFFVSVNFTLNQVSGQLFMDCIFNAVNEVGVTASNIVLEISNGGLVNDVKGTAKKLEAIKTLGVKVAIDNFTSEGSSIEALYGLPIDLVKISRTHTKNILSDINDQNFINNIKNIAHIVGFKVCAEGIETQETANAFIKMGVDSLQGYYYSKPLSDDFFDQAYKSNN